VTSFLCETCGTQYPPSGAPPARCAICEDERQYVPREGQQWVSYDDVRASHRFDVRDDYGVTGICANPTFAIGQRALLVDDVLWDCTPLVDEPPVSSLRAIAISHPHFQTTIAEWAERFDCPVFIHEADRPFIVRPERVEFWSGETLELGGGLTLIRVGGHFDGAQVLHRPGALFTGDVVAVRPAGRWVSFMRSYPMLIPLPAREVERIAAALEPWDFDRIYGGWWGDVVVEDAKDVVRRSVERYVRAVS